jgi:undecaprenyl-diphosphatase
VEWFQAIVLGVIQGLTEFLPVSSSAHLRIFPAFFGWQDPGAAFTAVTQIGTEAAVILYFWRDIWNIAWTWLRSLVKPEYRGVLESRLGWYIIVGSIPIGILGLAFDDYIETSLRSLWVMAVMLIVIGVVMGVADRYGSHSKPLSDLSMRDAVLYGGAQSLALIPGTSRSGATISMGLFLGYERDAAARYSFLLAIPAVFAAGLFQLPQIPGGDYPLGVAPTLLATVVAFVVGYAAIAWLLRYISTHTFTPFVIYRIALGTLVIIGLLTGTLEAYE